ncbi:MAG: peptide MFS transporter [Phycisphaerales bacterium]|nr:peptide MFS transporter [Phycisphaerales bacterium]
MTDYRTPNDNQPPASPEDAELLGTAERTLGQGRLIMGHPPGLFLLFLVEMWERFSYYGMRGLLVLYLVSVMAVHELAPGTYTNELRFTEVREVDGNGSVAHHRRQLQVVVGSGFEAVSNLVGTMGGAAADPGTGLVITRVEEVDDPANADSTIWTPLNVDSTAPVVVKGEKGNKEFDTQIFSYAVTNPTAETIKVRVGINRDVAQPGDPIPASYFTVNNSPGQVTVDIKPDSERGADKPYVATVRTNNHESGRNWDAGRASVLYGWYTGLAYLFPILGGILADKLIGTHRSMLMGGLLISLGHVILGLSGMADLAQSPLGMSVFITGLAVIVLGTGHFKPTVSVMVGQLYPQGDPRRDGAFTIFYMGINLGAFICAFVCGTLGEKVGWHWGFGSAAVGMIAGLLLYLWGKPRFLRGIGDAPLPPAKATSTAWMLFIAALAAAGLFGFAYHAGMMGKLAEGMSYIAKDQILRIVVPLGLLLAVLAWAVYFVMRNAKDDRGPVITIFVFMFFNAFFWLAFEQAGSSVNLFTEQNTDRFIGSFEVPATWFQSVNAGLIFIMAPMFAALWTYLGRRKMNPSQPVKIALGLIFLGLGFVFMVMAGRLAVGGAAKASMVLILATYFWHTVGELCLSPTGLSYVTKAAPKQFVALLMGIWFVSSFIANLGGGLVASQVEDIASGKVKTPWEFGGQADFFFLFVVTSIGAGVVILILTPLLKKLMRPGT